jgi:hypothetical protein
MLSEVQYLDAESVMCSETFRFAQYGRAICIDSTL